MASKYEIATTFKAIDNFSKPVKQASTLTGKYMQKMSKDVEKMRSQFKAMGQAVKLAAVAGVAMAGKAAVDGIKLYSEMASTIDKAGAKFSDLEIGSAGYDASLQELKETAKTVGAQTMFSANDAAGALDKMAMAGMTSKQAMASLMGMTKLATSTDLDLTTAVDMATDSLGQFGLMTSDTEQLAKNMDRLSDVVVKGTTMANFDMSMWFESAKMGAPIFTSLGESLETFTTMTAVLANNGIKGTMAGTGLRNIMARISAPTEKATKAMESLGVSVYDSNGNFVGITDVLERFEKAFDTKGMKEYKAAVKEVAEAGGDIAEIDISKFFGGASQQKQMAALKEIVGTANIGSFLLLLGEGTEKIREMTAELERSGGTASEVAKAYEQSIQGRMSALKSAWEGLLINLGDAFMENGGREALNMLIEKLQNFDPKPLAQFMAGVASALPGIIDKVSKFVGFLWDIKDVLEIGVAAWVAYKGAVLGAMLLQNVQTFASAVGGIGGALGLATTAQTGFNVAAAAFPYGWIIAAIGAVIMLAKKMYEAGKAMNDALGISQVQKIQLGWQGFKHMMRSLGLAIKMAFLDIGKGIWTLLGKIPFMTDLANKNIADIEAKLAAAEEEKAGLGERNKQELLDKGFTEEQLKRASWVSSQVKGFDVVRGSFDASVWEEAGAKYERHFGEPVTQGERTAYSVTETNTNTSTEVNIKLAKGLDGTMSQPAPGVSVQTTKSGSFGKSSSGRF